MELNTVYGIVFIANVYHVKTVLVGTMLPILATKAPKTIPKPPNVDQTMTKVHQTTNLQITFKFKQ